jgi:hypothetical protein
VLAAARPMFGEDSSRAANKAARKEESFQWHKAIWQSFLEFVVANGYRAATQADTRQAIQGPFWQNYANSMQNLYGWNDGDGFFTSYVLHPMEGAAGGYIERQTILDIEMWSSATHSDIGSVVCGRSRFRPRSAQRGRQHLSENPVSAMLNYIISPD